MDKCSVSVIVPMYNASSTIEECLESIISQSLFKKMELIVVDDCSTDECVKKVMLYEEKYPKQICVVRLNENAGPGHARNVGMEYASGEYIGFVDSDDAIYPAMYEKLYNEAIRTSSDIVDTGFYDQNKDMAIVYTSDDLKGELDSVKRSGLIVSGGYIWSKIFRRDFIQSNGICFRDEYVLEDMDFLIEVFVKAKNISNVKEILYVYRNSESSLSKTARIDKYLRCTVGAMKAVYKKTIQLPWYEEIRESVEYALLQLYSYSVNICIQAAKNETKTLEEVLTKLKELCELKRSLIKGSYENGYVKCKMSKEDILIMEENDRSPEGLLKSLLGKQN